MKRIIFCFFLFVGTCAVSQEGRVRTVAVKVDQIVTVKTALGIATIIQVPDSPNSVVVGDQSAFKVEYLDQAITIKPLVGGAKSNLYIYTDWKRYNVQLVTGSSLNADYVVYLKSSKKEPPGAESRITWRNTRYHLQNDRVKLEVNRLGADRKGVLLVEFSLKTDQRVDINPEWFWLTQNGVTKTIHSFYISSLSASKGQAVKGVIQVLKSDIDLNEPLRLELRRKNTSYLTMDKVSSWKTQ